MTFPPNSMEKNEGPSGSWKQKLDSEGPPHPDVPLPPVKNTHTQHNQLSPWPELSFQFGVNSAFQTGRHSLTDCSQPQIRKEKALTVKVHPSKTQNTF